jgi:hypothetical protein
MSGFGHMAEFSRQVKENNRLRRERRKNYKKKIGTYSEKDYKFKFKVVSEEKLILIKQKIRKQALKDKHTNIKILICSIIIGLPLFIFLFKLFTDLTFKNL